jgi:hypothetical protein
MSIASRQKRNIKTYASGYNAQRVLPREWTGLVYARLTYTVFTSE